MFKPGQKVICINDSVDNIDAIKDFDYWVRAGKFYTVRECKYSQLTGKYGVKLKEIKNSPRYFGELMGKAEPAYNSDRFRAVGDEKDEELMEILEAIEDYELDSDLN